jgi:hypothetical protein
MMSATFKYTTPFLALASLSCHMMAQGIVGGGGPLPEDDGEFIYRVAPVSMAFDKDVSSNLEIAEDLYFAGVNRVLTDLTFNYKSDYAQVGGMVVTVYAEGGPDANGLFLPGAKLLEKPVDVRVGSGLASVALAYSSANTVPDRVIVSVRFVDVPSGGSISLVTRSSAPEIGSTRPGYLERTGPGDQDWALRPLVDNSGNQVNFLLGVKAAAVPEGSTVALGLAGVAVLLLAGLRRRS